MSRKEFFESFSIFAEKNNVDETWTASMTGFWSSIHDYQLVEKGTNRCCLTRPKKDVMQTRFSTMDATEETGMSCVDVSNKVWGSAREWGVHSRLPRPRLAKAHRQWSGERSGGERGGGGTAPAARDSTALNSRSHPAPRSCSPFLCVPKCLSHRSAPFLFNVLVFKVTLKRLQL